MTNTKILSIKELLAVGIWQHEKSDAAMITQGSCRSNYVLFGGTIAASSCGEEGAAAAAVLAEPGFL